ncbi:hypothetical protein ACJRO7_002494 [Eucalyptus globulus]|uniref:Uncharacterized protein n=1 Tax=Eucalyptus globulus TaxID=34317 RepID=A0ABD3LUK3_EUCGL
METLTFPRIFIVVLLLSGMCMVMVPHVNAKKRCKEVLDPNSCTLSDCQKACSEKHPMQRPHGACLPDPKHKFSCSCYFNC